LGSKHTDQSDAAGRAAEAFNLLSISG
jgi:hypothetical protein